MPKSNEQHFTTCELIQIFIDDKKKKQEVQDQVKKMEDQLKAKHESELKAVEKVIFFSISISLWALTFS